MTACIRCGILAVLLLLLNMVAIAQHLAASGTAPSEEAAAAELQKAVQNPVANLISVPLQNNTNFAVGPYNRTQDVLNIQPVIPSIIARSG